MKIYKKADAVLIAALCIFAAAFYSIFPFFSYGGDLVVIKVSGSVYNVSPLSEDAEVEIRPDSNTHSNIVEIRDGRVSMIYANCPDGLCIKQGSINNGNGIIVCLPNRVTAEISKTEKEFDAIAK